ncbi:CHAT domain-containing protein [bacterium]|nr:CHAT domain-containing protein [bacterium]
MSNNQQARTSPPIPENADLLAQLAEISPNDVVAYLDSKQLTSKETATLLVSAALDQAESASRAAAHWLALATQINQRLGQDPALEAQILYAQARLHLHLGDLQEAEAALYTAQSYWQRLSDSAALARSYLGLTQILALQGRFDAAEDAIRQAIDLLPADNIQRAWAYINLANLLDRRGEYSAALESYAEARLLLLTLQRHHPASPEDVAGLAEQAAFTAQIEDELADLEVNRANVLVALDLPEEAENAYVRALDHFRRRGDVLQQGRLACNLGSLYLRTGRYADALLAFGQAEDALLGDHRFADDIDEARLRQADILLLDQANAYLALNLRSEAITTLERCQSLFRSADQPYELAQSLYLLGLLHLRSGHLEGCRRHLSEAYQLFADLNNGPWRNRTELALAEVDALHGENNAAIRRLDHLMAEIPASAGREMSTSPRDLSTTTEALLLRLQLHLQQDEIPSAQRLAAQIEALLAAAIPLPHLRQRLSFARGNIDLAQGQWAAARRHFYEALHILEDQRMSLPLEEFRTAYLADKYHIHANLVYSLLQDSPGQGETLHEVFDVIERARARSLHERIQSTRSQPREVDQSESVQPGNAGDASMYAKLHWLYNQIFDENTNPLDIRQEMQRYESLLERMTWRSTQPQTRPDTLMAQTQPVTLTEFQQHLDADQQALLYYIIQPAPGTTEAQANLGEVLAFLVDRKEVRLYRHLCTPAQLADAQRELRFQLGRAELGEDYLSRHRVRLNKALKDALHRLYNLLLGPMRPALHAPRLLLIPYGSLHLLPFHALWDGERHLIECFTCSYAPSASVTVRYNHQDRYAIPYQSFAGLALTDPLIPQAKREVELAAQSFTQRHLLLDEAASRAGLNQAAAQADVLHIATHGLFRPDNPFFSSLKLADGWIDVRAIYRIPLAARLVVLSACDSGSGDILGGDEVIGLARGFLGAGAQDLVVSLWNVHDARAVDLMAVFYEQLRQGATPAAALRAAQCHFIERGDHAYYWASFLAIGS